MKPVEVRVIRDMQQAVILMTGLPTISFFKSRLFHPFSLSHCICRDAKASVDKPS
jgi:hypothetical protein